MGARLKDYDCVCSSASLCENGIRGLYRPNPELAFGMWALALKHRKDANDADKIKNVHLEVSRWYAFLIMGVEPG